MMDWSILVVLVSLQDTSVIDQSQKKFEFQTPMILKSMMSWFEFQFVLEKLLMILEILVRVRIVALKLKSVTFYPKGVFSEAPVKIRV